MLKRSKGDEFVSNLIDKFKKRKERIKFDDTTKFDQRLRSVKSSDSLPINAFFTFFYRS